MPHRSFNSIVWISSRTALLAGFTLSALLVGGLVLAAMYEHREIVEFARQRNETLARVLEGQFSRTLSTAAVSLRAISDVAAAASAPDDPVRLTPTLQQALVGLPFLRSLAVVDDGGRILASTHGDDVDRRIDPAALGSPLREGADVLGPRQLGRYLGDLTDRAKGSSAVELIPFTRVMVSRGGRRHLLVAVINPDALANLAHGVLDANVSTAVLASYQGRLYTQAGPVAADYPGLSAHPVFRSLLAQREHGSYVGAGLAEGQQVVAFRTSRSWPVVVVVEEPLAVSSAHWVASVRWLAVLAVLVVGFVLTMSVAAHRSMRARERARMALDAAQRQVAYSERELSILVKSVQELIFRTDSQGRLTFVNARWPLLTGASSLKEVMGMPVAALVEVECRAGVEALFASTPGAGLRTTQARVRLPDGQLRLLDVAVSPLQSDGIVSGFAGSAVDVTERWRTEQKLQSQLALTGLLLEISPLPVSLTDDQGRFISVNQAWEEFTGVFRAEALGRRMDELAAPEIAQVFHQMDLQLLTCGGRERYEARLGERDVVLTKVLVPGDETRSPGILCVLMDVSEFREAERATQEARDAAEEASRSKSEFIANISHELRTPLQSIIGFSELGMVRGRAHEKLAAMFGDIHASGQRMLALVNDLLDVAKIESTVGTFHLERIDLRGLVRDVVREVGPLLARKQLRLDLALDEVPMVAKVDPLRFQQVIRNVLANAIKFSPPGAPVELTGAATSDGQWLFRVRDHGPGIPEGEQDRIFEAFVQSSSTKDGSGGTGLGLAICRKIAEGHGGSIVASNVPGGGACFTLRLPARGFAETAPAALDDASGA